MGGFKQEEKHYSLSLFRRPSKLWISSSGIPTVKSGAAPSWQWLWEISWFSRGRKCVSWPTFQSLHTKLGEPWHMAGFTRYRSLSPTALQRQLCRILSICLDLTSTQSNHLQIKFTFFFQAFSASWSWLKRSASDVWILSCGFVFFTLFLSVVNSASLRRQGHILSVFFFF